MTVTPFGLPLLWKSAGFSRGSKIVLTVAVMACSALPIETVLVAVRAAMEQIGLVGAPMTVASLLDRPGPSPVPHEPPAHAGRRRKTAQTHTGSVSESA